jgi:uncharacterized membrane protein YgdD (TMEM256/DUF423 family)
MSDSASATAIQCLRWGAALAGFGVILGAFGAHGLRDRLSESALNWYQTGVHYHLIHALGILAAGWAASTARGRWCAWAAGLFGAGIALFSGSLYAMALTGRTALGLITPLGGLCFIARLAGRSLGEAEALSDRLFPNAEVGLGVVAGVAARIPGRIPDQVELDILDPIQLLDRAVRRGHDLGTERAHLAGQGQLDVDLLAFVRNLDAAHQAELDDAETDLRIGDRH